MSLLQSGFVLGCGRYAIQEKHTTLFEIDHKPAAELLHSDDELYVGAFILLADQFCAQSETKSL